MSEEYLDTNNNSNAVNKMMTRLMNATASLHSSSNNHGGSGEATPLIVATAAAGSTVNESGAASSSSSSSLTSLIKVSSTVRLCLSRRAYSRSVAALLHFALEFTVIARSYSLFLPSPTFVLSLLGPTGLPA